MSEDLEAVEKLKDAYTRIVAEIEKVIIGQREIVDQLLIALLCGGHGLIVGVPGLAKTLLISTLARALNLSFSRIQFTPDLMPSDITGTEVRSMRLCWQPGRLRSTPMRRRAPRMRVTFYLM